MSPLNCLNSVGIAEEGERERERERERETGRSVEGGDRREGGIDSETHIEKREGGEVVLTHFKSMHAIYKTSTVIINN